MCEEGRPDENELGIRCFAGSCSDAYLLREPSSRGHTVVIWRGQHVCEPTGLEPAAATRYWDELLEVARALERTYRPVKLNIAINGNGVPHLHAHVVLRFAHDPAAGRPLPPATTRELDRAQLAEEVAALRAAFSERAGTERAGQAPG